jgi:hypothetical protein
MWEIYVYIQQSPSISVEPQPLYDSINGLDRARNYFDSHIGRRGPENAGSQHQNTPDSVKPEGVNNPLQPKRSLSCPRTLWKDPVSS